jgi:hypothetical protein
MRDPNLEQLIAAAEVLRPLLPELVFVGGCITGLLITDEAAGEPRGTIDVDAIAEITSYAQYAEFAVRLRVIGFKEDTSRGAPLCRWIQGRTILDVMPLDERILGFSNRWYKAAMELSVTKRLLRDLEIRVITAPYFIATKLEAFKGRGGGDFLGSHDLEDIVSVRDGREALLSEVRSAPPDLRLFMSHEIGKLLASPASSTHCRDFFFPTRRASRELASSSIGCGIWRRFDRAAAAYGVGQTTPRSRQIHEASKVR